MGGGNLHCDDNQDMVDGLCYAECPTGLHHVPGFPYQCVGADGISQMRGAGTVPGCKTGEVQSVGLCYRAPPTGYTNILGVEWQGCPPGTKDFGVGCTRESYTRGIGAIPWLGLFMNKGIVATICIIIALYIVIRVGSAVYAAKKGKQ